MHKVIVCACLNLLTRWTFALGVGQGERIHPHAHTADPIRPEFIQLPKVEHRQTDPTGTGYPGFRILNEVNVSGRFDELGSFLGRLGEYVSRRCCSALFVPAASEIYFWTDRMRVMKVFHEASFLNNL